MITTPQVLTENVRWSDKRTKEKERVVECERNRSAGVKQDVVGHQYALRQWELFSVGACGLVL